MYFEATTDLLDLELSVALRRPTQSYSPLQGVLAAIKATDVAIDEAYFDREQ